LEKLSHIETETLVKKSQKGHTKSQYTLYKHYSDAMFYVCFHLLQNTTDAEEVLQDSFIQAFEKLHQLKEPTNFGIWLKRITINKSLNFLRKNKLHFLELSLDIPEEIESEDIYTLDHEIINKAVKMLPVACRTVLNLYLLNGYKHKEIADLLNISISTSKSQYARAKHLLKESLKERMNHDR